jgi:hypothetical protein
VIKPLAKKYVIFEELEDEIVIYDEHDNEAHCLDAIAAFVWSRCDGERTVKQLRSELSHHLDQPVSKQQIMDLLAMMNAKNLLEPEQMAGDHKPLSRRKVLHRAVVVGTVGVSIQSIVAPTPTHAASCGNGGSPSSQPPPCHCPPQQRHGLLRFALHFFRSLICE